MRKPVTYPAFLFRIAGLALVLMSGSAGATAPVTVPADPAAVEIQRRLTAAGSELQIQGETVDGQQLRDFYQSRNWRPAWTDIAGQVTAQLAAADADGLPLRPLHAATLVAHAQTAGPSAQAEREILMTDGLLRYAAAMRGQRVNPTEIEDDWFLATPPFDALAFLKENSGDLLTALATLPPPYAGYQLLRQKLADLKAIVAAGDWPKVPLGPPIKPGAADDRLPDVRRRLAADGLAPAAMGEPSVYDDALQDAVKTFQRRHGLADDAVLGRQTIVVMNTSAAERARQVAVNMERWRWLPRRLEANHIVVNVPAASLEVVDDGRAVLTMRVIVGDQDHPTPALHAKMTSLVMNPVWRVPASIATEEILPKLKKDPGYLIANDLELVSDGFAPGSPESQGVGIAWKEMSVMPWPVRQRAGSDNALGRIKFNIPNSDDIYLHDTPNRKLFARAFRALSHGCVRVEKPEELALYVLRDKEWSAQKLDAEIDTGDTRTVTLSKTLPVWLLYWTAFVDADGVLQTRDDLYERDRRLAAALSEHSRAQQPMAHGSQIKPQVVRCDGCRIP